MAAEDITITCYDPDASDDAAVVFTREMRTGFKFSSTCPGGNALASWTVDCDHLRDTGFPVGRARILVQDPVRETYLWRGVLRAPKLFYERGRLVKAQFTATGCAEGSRRQFPGVTVFGVTDRLATVEGRIVVVNMGDAIKHGLTITPLIDGVQTGIQNGGVLTEDTRDYRGNVAPQLWEDICILTRGLEEPFVWMVEPDITGKASLLFQAQQSNPSYWEFGQAKSNELEIDYHEIANQIYVAYQTEVIHRPDIGEELDYTNTPDIQTHFVDMSTTINEVSSAQGFAGSLLNKFNQRTITGGSLILDRELRTNIGGPLAMIPPYEIRAGRVIKVQITKVPYLPAVLIDMLISQIEYDEDNCQVTISPSAIGEAGKQARLLMGRAEHSKANWAWTSASSPLPAPELQKISLVRVATTTGGYYTDGWANPSQPWVTVGGWTVDAGVIEGANPLPTPVTEDPPAGAEPPPVKLSSIPLIYSRKGYLDGWLGPIGAKIPPQLLPEDRLNIPAIFSTSHPLTGLLDDGARAHTDVQEGWFDTVTCSTLGGVLVSVTINVDIWNWDMNAIRVADAFTITLSNENVKRVQYDNSELATRPIALFHGDQLRWKVESPSVEAVLNCAITGWRSWKESPIMIGPDWVPGNA